MGNLGNILKNKIEELGISKQVEAVDIVERATKEIAKFIPAEDFEVVSFNKGIIKIAVKSSSVANEILFLKPKIIILKTNKLKINQINH